MPANKNNNNNVSLSMRKYLKSRSFAQLQAMVVTIHELQGFVAPKVPLSEADLIMHSNYGPELSAVQRQREKNPNKIVKKKAVPHTLPAPAKRPLNSWMAFRSTFLDHFCFLFLTYSGYYSPVFTSQQQKEISTILTQLWQQDPFHAKWSILAQAYSEIRNDVGKALAPLDNFLGLTCPYIGIIGPDEYLSKLGWEVVSDEGHKTIERKFLPDFESFNEDLRTSNLSARDIVEYCQTAGYVVRIPGSPDLTSSSKLTMASLPASNKNSTPSWSFSNSPGISPNRNDGFSILSTATNHTRFLFEQPTSMMSEPAARAFPDDFSDLSDLAASDRSGMLYDFDAFMPIMPFDELSNDFQFLDIPQDGHMPTIDPSMLYTDNSVPTAPVTSYDFEQTEASLTGDFELAEVTAPYAVQMMEEQHAIVQNSGSHFPYYEQFDPAQKDDDLQLLWDPNCGDAFDAFDVSTWRSAYNL